MATALIQFTQGSNTDAAGKAVLGEHGNFSAVTVANGNNAGVVSWKVYLLDVPPDSVTYPVASQPQILAQAVNGTPTTVFTPDVAGTYRVMLEVTDNLGSVDRDIRCFGIPDRRGFVRPPFQEFPEPLPVAPHSLISINPRPNKPDEQNYAANRRGWAGNGSVGQLDQFFQQYDDLAQKLVTTTPYSALVTDPPLHKVNVTGAPVFNLPSGPRPGFVVRVVCIGDPVTITPQGSSANISGFPTDVLRRSEAAVYVYQGSNTWQVLSRELARSRILPEGALDNQVPVWNDDDQTWGVSAGSAYFGGVSVLDYLPGNSMVEAINAAFADTSDRAREVYFPPGVYVIDAPIVSAVDFKAIRFIPGAVLQMTPQEGCIFSVTGTDTRVYGLHVNLQDASDLIFTAVEVRGVRSILHDRVVIEVFDNDIPNATLLRISGDRIHIHNLQIASDGRSFWRGLHLERAATGGEGYGGLECGYCVVYGAIFEPGDPGQVVKTFDALVYWRAISSELHNFLFFGGGGRIRPNACIFVEGHRNILYNPRIFSFGALYGIKTADSAEFLQVIGGSLQGRNSGDFVAGSEGISCGHFAGHLKLYGTAIHGWETGVVFHGSHDTPGFYGAVIANNGTYGIKIDCRVGSDNWQVSGLILHGCYAEDANGFQVTFMYLKTGVLVGCSMEGCYIGYSHRAVLVDPEFQGNSISFSGNRLGGVAGQAVTEPGQYSSFLFLNNSTDGTSTLGLGAYAANAMSVYDPVLTGLKIGATGSRITRMESSIYTANFGTVAAASTVQLNFTFAGVNPTFSQVNATLSNGLGSKLGIIYTWWISTHNTISGTATNVTGASITGVSGGVRFTVTTHT